MRKRNKYIIYLAPILLEIFLFLIGILPSFYFPFFITQVGKVLSAGDRYLSYILTLGFPVGVDSVTIVDAYSYDGYGVMLQNGDTFLGGGTQTPGTTAKQASNLLYTGEQYDSSLSQYYLRARYYNPSNGLFNRTDPYSGKPRLIMETVSRRAMPMPC